MRNHPRTVIAPFNKGGGERRERGIFRRVEIPPCPPLIKGGNGFARGSGVWRVSGFTLIEVLLAMAITALVAVMGYAGLTTAMSAASRHEETVRRIGEIQTAVSWMTRDLRQSVDRSILDARGDEMPALIGTLANEQLLELTHTGWDNPRGQHRSALQRVRYRLDNDGVLWRDYWLAIDRLDDDDHLQRVKLLSGVKSLKWQFLDGQSANAKNETLGGEWVEQWPVGKNTKYLPLAVQFDLETDDLGIVHRVIALAGEQNAP